LAEAAASTLNYRKFSIEPYSPKEKEWAIVASYKTKGKNNHGPMIQFHIFKYLF